MNLASYYLWGGSQQCFGHKLTELLRILKIQNYLPCLKWKVVYLDLPCHLKTHSDKQACPLLGLRKHWGVLVYTHGCHRVNWGPYNKVWRQWRHRRPNYGSRGLYFVTQTILAEQNGVTQPTLWAETVTLGRRLIKLRRPDRGTRSSRAVGSRLSLGGVCGSQI